MGDVLIEPPPTWGWDEWNSAIAAHFFPPASPDTLQLLSVDADSMGGITGLDSDQASGLLCTLVAREVGSAHDVRRVATRLSKWESGDRMDAPPVLPLLAVAVLAATEMGSDDAFGPLAYYPHYRRLLGLTGDQVDEPSGYGDHFPHMWRTLRGWVESRPDRGRTSIEQGARPFIGFALGQAAFRQTDLPHLHRFFRAHGVTADDEQPELLLAYLAGWTAMSDAGPLKRLHRLASTNELADQCLAIIGAAISSWDPSQPDGSGGSGRYGTVHLALRDMPRSIELWARLPAGCPDGAEWHLPDGAACTLGSVGEGWSKLPSKDTSPLAALSGGLELSCGEWSLVFPRAKVHPLQWDNELGQYVSASLIDLGTTYHLLVSIDVMPAVQEFISEAALDARLDPSLTQYFDSKWVVFRDFRVDVPPQCAIPADLALSLGRGGLPRMHLTGGLRFPDLRRTYLTGGAPSLALPESYEDAFSLSFDGYPTAERFQVPPARAEFPLDVLAPSAGTYEVSFGDFRLRFAMTDGMPRNAGEGMGSVRLVGHEGFVRGYVVECADGGTPASRLIRLVPLHRHGPQAEFLGSRGDQVCTAIGPVWIDPRDGGTSWVVTDAPDAFDPIWRVDHLNGSLELQLVGEGEPEPVRQAANLWVRSFREGRLHSAAGPEERALFSRFQKVAGECSYRPVGGGVPPRMPARLPKPPTSDNFDARSGYDALLRWCSEAGAGNWSSLKEAAASIQRRWPLYEQRRSWVIADRLADLGHLDIDWRNRKWSVSPPSLSMLPGTGGCAVLSGARTNHLQSRLFRDMPVDVGDFEIHPLDAPTAIYFKVGSVGSLVSFAASHEIPLVVDPATQLANLLPSTQDSLRSAPPPRTDANLKWLDVNLSEWIPFVGKPRDGLYLSEYAGLRSHRLCRGGEWLTADDDGHLYAAAYQAARLPVFRWKPRDDRAGKASRLLVPARLRLPSLARRALVACSGQLPEHRPANPPYLLYRNVDHQLAIDIGARMGLMLVSQ